SGGTVTKRSVRGQNDDRGNGALSPCWPFERKEITDLGAAPPQGPDRQLEDRLAGAGGEGHAPGRERFVEAEHPALGVEEEDVDGEPHEEGVDAVAGGQVESLAHGQLAAHHQASEAIPEAFSAGGLRREHAVAGDIGDLPGHEADYPML